MSGLGHGCRSYAAMGLLWVNDVCRSGSGGRKYRGSDGLLTAGQAEGQGDSGSEDSCQKADVAASRLGGPIRDGAPHNPGHDR
jgi:hypothetical protein